MDSTISTALSVEIGHVQTHALYSNNDEPKKPDSASRIFEEQKIPVRFKLCS
jgi:hypothetical protein